MEFENVCPVCEKRFPICEETMKDVSCLPCSANLKDYFPSLPTIQQYPGGAFYFLFPNPVTIQLENKSYLLEFVQSIVSLSYYIKALQI